MIQNSAKVYDIAIVGAGPAGLTAAIYALRDDKTVILFEKNVEGGQILNTNSIVNIPGFAEISGENFIDKMMDQIASLPNSDTLLTTVYEDVIDIRKEGDNFFITTDESPDGYVTKSVVCATGSTYRKLNVPGEQELIGKGVSFCSTCDAPFYRGKDVIVVGGGNSALTEAIELSKFVKSVHIYQNLPVLTAAPDLIAKVTENPKITVTCNSRITGFDRVGDQIKYWVAKNDEDPSIPHQIKLTDGVFIAIGLAPYNKYASNIGKLDAQGYIDELVDGAYAAGDCKKITANQVVVACGSGAKAAIKACRYLNLGR